MVINAVGLTKNYHDVVAVDDLTLHIAPGEVYALLGLNGASKTTTIRMLLGMVRPTGGTVSVLGTRIRPGRTEMWSRVGYLVETPAAYPELTVVENLRVAARLRGMKGPAPVAEIVSRLGLEPYADHRARTLSLGNAQRLGLAKALLHRPELLVLDEPANGLDPAGVAEIRALLHDLTHEQGVTVVLSSHILTEVDRLATRIGVIHDGRLLRELDRHDLAAQARPRLSVTARDHAAASTALARGRFPHRRRRRRRARLAEDHAVRHPDRVATVLVEAGCPPTRLGRRAGRPGDLLPAPGGPMSVTAAVPEVLKARRSRVPWVTVAAFTIAALFGGLVMFILQDLQRARALGLLGTKAALAGGNADWPAYFALLAQTVAVGGP